jgi:hypothetical protein
LISHIPGIGALIFIACLFLIFLILAFLGLLALVVVRQIIVNGRAIRDGLRELYGKSGYGTYL